MTTFQTFKNIAKTKERNYLINQLDSLNYIKKDNLLKLHKNTICTFWANMMEEKIEKAINKI